MRARRMRHLARRAVFPCDSEVVSVADRATTTYCHRGSHCQTKQLESVHKGELARSVSKSAPPTATNVTGSRPFTESGASSPSTTNVNTTHTAVGIVTPGNSTPHTTDKPLLGRGEVEARLSDGVGLGPTPPGLLPDQRPTSSSQVWTGHGEIVLALDHRPWSVVRTYSPSMTTGPRGRHSTGQQHQAFIGGYRGEGCLGSGHDQRRQGPELEVPRILLSMHQPGGFRPHGWADLATGGGETVAELVGRHGSELLELPK